MSTFAPYVSSMRLGQGFNTLTGQICIEDAVVFTHPEPSKPAEAEQINPTNSSMPSVTNGVGTPVQTPSDLAAPSGSDPAKMNQTVVFSSRQIDRVADLLTELNLSAGASIILGTVKARASAGYINEKKINNADFNYVVSVKVTNEANRSTPKVVYNPIPNLASADFGSVFGDCFIADFLEGGEFLAVISLKKITDNHDTAFNQQLQVDVPVAAALPVSLGLSVGIDRHKNKDFAGYECTVSVSWVGGGDIQPRRGLKTSDKSAGTASSPNTNGNGSNGVDSAKTTGLAIGSPDNRWDTGNLRNIDPKTSSTEIEGKTADDISYQDVWTVEQAIQAAVDFPTNIAKYPQRTSAVLVDYTALRSFQEAQVAAGDGKKMQVPDYSRCQIYAIDLFSAYMAYKENWDYLSEMLHHSVRYQKRNVADAIEVGPMSLNLARLECRKGMAQIVKEFQSLVNSPEKADSLLHDASNTGSSFDQSPPDASASDIPYKFPALLAARLPEKCSTSKLPRKQTELISGTQSLNLDEIDKVLALLRNDQSKWRVDALLGGSTNETSKLFCTVRMANAGGPDSRLTSICTHTYKHHHLDDFHSGALNVRFSNEFHGVDKAFDGALAHIGVTLGQGTGQVTEETRTHFGCTTKPCADAGYLDHLDLFSASQTQQPIIQVEVDYDAKCVGGLRLTTYNNNVLKRVGSYRALTENGWLSTKKFEAPFSRVSEQSPGSWELYGFWGYAGAQVIEQLAPIWKRRE